MSTLGPSKVGSTRRKGIDLAKKMLRGQCAHTNMLLDRSLNSFVATSLPWEMEMIVDEPDEVVLSGPSGLEVIEL